MKKFALTLVVIALLAVSVAGVGAQGDDDFLAGIEGDDRFAWDSLDAFADLGLEGTPTLQRVTNPSVNHNRWTALAHATNVQAVCTNTDILIQLASNCRTTS